MVMNVASVTRAFAGEQVCGDRCAWWLNGSRLILAVADGLGHGVEAAVAADRAIECIAEQQQASCEALFQYCDHHLQATRGVALTVAIIELEANSMTLASVGNIRNVLLQGDSIFRLGGARGIVGGGFACLAPETVSLSGDALLVIYTDGLDEVANLRPYHHQQGVTVSQQARAILDTWQTTLDDAGVLVYRHQG